MLLLILLFVCNTFEKWNTDGTEYNTININDKDRSFLLYHPGVNLNVEYPLWVLLHGQSTNSMAFAENTDFFMVAKEKEVIAVYPEGHCYEEIENMCCWNTGHLKGLKVADWSLDDIKFLDELLTQLKSNYEVGEIIITGFSAGAFMAHTYAINVTEHEIFAILPIAGHIGGVGYPFQTPVTHYDPNIFGVQSEFRPHVVTVFGGNDGLVKIKGGVDFAGREDFSMKQDLDFWMDANECINQHISFNYYDMEDNVKLGYYGEQCQKLVGYVIVENAIHSISSYDKIFLEGKNKESFTRYSKTLMELSYNLVAYEIKKVSVPGEDPDPEPPTDGDYQWWIFSNNACHLSCTFIFIFMVICLLF